MIVQFRRKEAKIFQVKITLSRIGIWVSFLPLSSGSFQLGHHRIVTYGKQEYSFVPHSHVILHYCAFGIFCPPFFLWVLLHAFLSEFFIQVPLSLVSFCVRDVCNFQLTDGEELLAIQYLYGLVLCFDTYCFLRSFDSS